LGQKGGLAIEQMHGFDCSFSYRLVGLILRLMDQACHGALMSVHSNTNSFGFSIKNKTMWQLVKPHSQSLIAYFIFPQMCFSDLDAELWSEDPVEFVHKKIG
jgi:hypothetical protein